MKYVAKPVIVTAYKIIRVEDYEEEIGCNLILENGEDVLATPEMLSRITPIHGDYWVIQEDGYVYINPKSVFERKYCVHEKTSR
jgi:hypothetical protein